MEQFGNKVEVTDREGWAKTFSLKKTIIHIGAALSNDIILNPIRGGGVAQRHAQLILTPGAGYQLVNLGDTNIYLGDTGDNLIAPHASVNIGNGENITIGDFSIIFRLTGTGILMGGTSPQSKSIGLTLSLPGTRLIPQRPLEGALNVSNHGEKPGVQFKLEIEGIPPECYSVGTAPILFPNVSKSVPICFEHVGGDVPAGEYHVSIHATAQEAYPGEIATVSQIIHVIPHYQHVIKLMGST